MRHRNRYRGSATITPTGRIEDIRGLVYQIMSAKGGYLGDDPEFRYGLDFPPPTPLTALKSPTPLASPQPEGIHVPHPPTPTPSVPSTLHPPLPSRCLRGFIAVYSRETKPRSPSAPRPTARQNPLAFERAISSVFEIATGFENCPVLFTGPFFVPDDNLVDSARLALAFEEIKQCVNPKPLVDLMVTVLGPGRCDLKRSDLITLVMEDSYADDQSLLFGSLLIQRSAKIRVVPTHLFNISDRNLWNADHSLISPSGKGWKGVRRTSWVLGISQNIGL